MSKLRHIPVGRLHARRKVLLFVAGADVRIVTTDGTLLRQLTLDTSRSYQPLGGRWPVVWGPYRDAFRTVLRSTQAANLVL